MQSLGLLMKKTTSPATQPTNISGYLTEQNAAEFLAVSVKTLQRWRWIMKGPAYKKLDSGTVRYSIADLINYAENSTVQPTRN